MILAARIAGGILIQQQQQDKIRTNVTLVSVGDCSTPIQNTAQENFGLTEKLRCAILQAQTCMSTFLSPTSDGTLLVLDRDTGSQYILVQGLGPDVITRPSTLPHVRQ